MRLSRLVPPVTLAAVLLLAVLTQTSTADFPDFSSPYTQDNDGNCHDDPVDPVNLVFFGDEAGLHNTTDQIEQHAGWHHNSGSGQMLRVRKNGSDYECQPFGRQRADGGSLDSRFHARLWFIPATEGGGADKKTAAAGHHEDFVFSCFGHAVDSNGSDGSGFDQGRRKLRDKFSDGGHATDKHYWGNTRNFRQCDDDLAGSDGYGITIHIGHQ